MNAVTHPGLSEAVAHLPPLGRLSELPKFARMLTGVRHGFVFSLPQQMSRHLCAIEVGAKKATLLYDPDQLKLIEPYLRQLRGHLISEGFQITRPDLRCTTQLIVQLGSESAGDDNEEEGMVRVAELSNSEARKLFEGWIEEAVRQRATDLHVQTVGNLAEIKLRIDGELELLKDLQGGVYPAAQAERAVAWAYNNASGRGSNSDSQFTGTENQYCMIAAREVLGKRLTLRYQSLRGWAGLKVVCRLLFVDADSPTLTYEQLGYAPSQIEQLEVASYCQSGLVIFAGVTGSGKTTSLKTFVETHPSNGTDAFYSIEDPVEYPLRGVHQIPVQRDLLDREGSARKYGEVVAALMRADPGCVLMGEVRDMATASSAQQIVETGHTACCTVHAHLISGIVPRLTNSEIGLSRDVLTNPNMLSLLVYQALVPMLCQHCCLGLDDLETTGKHRAHIGRITAAMNSRFGLGTETLRFKNPDGCPQCNHRGTKGLTVVAEILSPDGEWLALIKQGKDLEALQHYRASSDGRFDSADMTGKTVFEHTLYKALQGQVDVTQCERFGSFFRQEKTQTKGVIA